MDTADHYGIPGPHTREEPRAEDRPKGAGKSPGLRIDCARYRLDRAEGLDTRWEDRHFACFDI